MKRMGCGATMLYPCSDCSRTIHHRARWGAPNQGGPTDQDGNGLRIPRWAEIPPTRGSDR
jgi:DNA-directed RNA polymerase subunit RPC12/RpoP